MDSATFKARYTEFESVEDSIVNTQLEECSTLLNAERYGSKYQMALFLLMAHELQLIAKPPKEVGGVVVSKSIEGGGVSIKNLATNENQLYYSLTSYGQKFLAIKKTVRFVGAVLCD